MSTSDLDLAAAWFGKPTAPQDPLAAVRLVADHLCSDQAPQPSGRLVANALQAFLVGSRLEHALGLPEARSGQRTPVQIAAMERRNAMIRELAELLPGKMGDKADAIAALLSATGRPRCGILAADMLAEELRALKQAGLELPASSRQIRRLLCGK